MPSFVGCLSTHKHTHRHRHRQPLESIIILFPLAMLFFGSAYSYSQHLLLHLVFFFLFSVFLSNSHAFSFSLVWIARCSFYYILFYGFVPLNNLCAALQIFFFSPFSRRSRIACECLISFDHIESLLRISHKVINK